MKFKFFHVTALLCLLGSGCRFSHILARTTIVEPIKYASYLDEKLEKKHFRHLARCAFEQEQAVARAELDDYNAEPFSVDAQRGFEDGFVDYLMAGGRAEPPALPPRRYWKTKYQNPVGQWATQEWFNGYRHGASVARQSGYRDFVTVPTGDAVALTTEPYVHTTMIWQTTEHTDEMKDDVAGNGRTLDERQSVSDASDEQTRSEESAPRLWRLSADE